jgi:hypothetical protein
LLVNWRIMKPIELSEAEVETLWLDEAERREQAWDAGEVAGIPAEQVMHELRSGSSDRDPLIQSASAQRLSDAPKPACVLLAAAISEDEWLRAAARNPVFRELEAPEEDVYSLDGGDPFRA